MSMQYVRDYYKVPAKRGGRIRYTGEREPRIGTIVAAYGASLRIRHFADRTEHHIVGCRCTAKRMWWPCVDAALEETDEA